MDSNRYLITAAALVLAGIVAWSVTGDKRRFTFYLVFVGCVIAFLVIGWIAFGPEATLLGRVPERAPNPLAAEVMIPDDTPQPAATPAVVIPIEASKPVPQHFQRLFIAARALMPKQTAHAPDDAVLACFRSQLKIAEDLIGKQPAALHQCLFGESAKRGLLAPYAEPAAQQAAVAALGRLVEQAVTRPQSPPTPAVAELLLDTITKDIETTGGVDLSRLDMVEGREEDAVTLCTTLLMFYKKILDLPPVAASHVIRYLVVKE